MRNFDFDEFRDGKNGQTECSRNGNNRDICRYKAGVIEKVKMMFI